LCDVGERTGLEIVLNVLADAKHQSFEALPAYRYG
jgi:hypothetical protein